MNSSNRRCSIIRLTVILAALTGAGIATGSGRLEAMPQTGDGGLFVHDRMTEMKLSGLRIWLGNPVTVTSQISWGTRWLNLKGQPEMMFAHFFPSIARFPGGNLIAIYCLDADSAMDPVYVNGFQISRDGGASWERRYTLIMQHNSDDFVPLADDSLLAIPSELMQRVPGDDRNFIGLSTRFEHGGDRIVIVPDGVRVVDWPWPVGISAGNLPRQNWRVRLTIIGSVIRLGSQLLATAFAPRPEDNYGFFTTVLIASKDDGRTWRYFSTIAGPDPALKGQTGYAGPCEPALIRLSDGDLMAVFRLGGGSRGKGVWNLGRCYSHDGGRAWTRPDLLPGYSVMPSLVRTANGTIALSSGRPGIGLWLSADARGVTWQKIDIIAHHNAWAPDPSYRISSLRWGDPASFDQNPLYPGRPNPGSAGRSEVALRLETTSYTKLVEVAPNRLLLIYDRDAVVRPPDRPPTSRHDLSRVFVLPIEIERD